MNSECIISLVFKLSTLTLVSICQHVSSLLFAGRQKKAGVPLDLFTVSFCLWPFGIWKLVPFFYILSLRFLFAWHQRAKCSLLTVVTRQQIQSCTLPSAPECHIRVRCRLSWDSFSGINWPVFNTAGDRKWENKEFGSSCRGILSKPFTCSSLSWLWC